MISSKKGGVLDRLSDQLPCPLKIVGYRVAVNPNQGNCRPDRRTRNIVLEGSVLLGLVQTTFSQISILDNLQYSRIAPSVPPGAATRALPPQPLEVVRRVSYDVKNECFGRLVLFREVAVPQNEAGPVRLHRPRDSSEGDNWGRNALAAIWCRCCRPFTGS